MVAGRDQSELKALLETLETTQRRIRELVGEDVDAVLLPGGGIELLPEAQSALQQEERLQRQFAAQRAAVLDALPAQIALLDADGVIIAVNEAWRRFGRDNGNPDPLHGVGSSYLAACEPMPGDPGAPDFARGIRAVLDGRVDSFRAEYPCHAPFEARWFRLQVVPVQLSGQRGAAVMHFDISADYQAAAARSRALRLFAIASKVARIGGWSLDLQTGELEWSDEVFAIHGMDKGEDPPVGDAALARVAPEWRELARRRLRACLQQGVSYDEEFELLLPDGERLWVRSSGEAVRDRNGRITHIQGALQDISGEKTAASALAQSEGRFQRMAQVLPLLLWTASAEGRLDYANPAFYARLGLTEDSLSPTLWEWVDAEDRERAMAAWWESVASGQPYTAELRLRTADGESRWMQMSAAAARDEQGRVLKWYGTGVDIHDRVLAEDEALRLANQLQLTLNSINDSFVALDAEWRYTFVNDQAAAFFRRPRAEILGTRIWDSFPTLLGTELERGLREVMASRQARIFEHASALGIGVLDVSAYPAADGGLAIYFRDITERVEARQRLEHEEARFRAVTQAVTDVVWDWNLEARRIWWSRGLSSKFGHTEGGQETDASFWAELLHPEDREGVLASIRKLVNERAQHWEAKYRFRHADGSYREVEDRGVVIFDRDGAPRRMVGGMQDVTAARRAATQLAQQAALLDQARDAIMLCDGQNRIRFWNRSAERIYGWGAESVRGQSLPELLGAETAEVRHALAAVRAEGEWRGRLRQHRSDGSTLTVVGHWVRVDPEVMAADAEDGAAVMAINTDISDQLLLEEQLQQAQRLESVGQLTGGIAHDFNNLLTIVLGNADLLLEGLQQEDELQEMAAMIQTAAERAAELTRRLLAFARKQPLEPRRVDVNHLLAGMERLLRRTLGGEIEIELVQGAGLWPALVDGGQLENAVLNLCLNARDAMSGGGRLTLDTGNAYLDEIYASHHAEVLPGEYVRVSVSDTGSGMAPEVLDRAFDPFFTTKEVGRGSGLGLSMVYGFAKQSRGHVRIYSELGEGSTVHLYLPRSVGADEAEPGMPSDLESRLRGQGECILLVEDDDLVREHLAAQLLGLGYRVLAARNGAEGLQHLRGDGVLDLLFTDVVMPGGMSGRQLADAALDLRPGLPVLFTSGYTEDAIMHHGRLDPGVQLLSKPYRLRDLAAKVRRTLKHGRQR